MAEILANELSKIIKSLPDPNNYHGEYFHINYGLLPPSVNRAEAEKVSNVELKTVTF